MDSTDWNKAHPIETKVVLTLANGSCLVTRTASEAATWGGMAHAKVEAISQGFVPLSWVRALLPAQKQADSSAQVMQRLNPAP